MTLSISLPLAVKTGSSIIATEHAGNLSVAGILRITHDSEPFPRNSPIIATNRVFAYLTSSGVNSIMLLTYTGSYTHDLLRILVMLFVILFVRFFISSFENGYCNRDEDGSRDGGGVNNLEAKKRLGEPLTNKGFTFAGGNNGNLCCADILQWL